MSNQKGGAYSKDAHHPAGHDNLRAALERRRVKHASRCLDGADVALDNLTDDLRGAVTCADLLERHVTMLAQGGRLQDNLPLELLVAIAAELPAERTIVEGEVKVSSASSRIVMESTARGFP